MAYLLPCPQCGRKHVVTTGQAGGQVRCDCGAAVEVPTVRGLRELEPAAPAEPESSWTTRHSLLFLGALITIAGIAFGVLLHFRAQRELPRDTFADRIHTMPPADTWTLWSQYFRHGITWQPKTGPEREKAFQRYAELKRWQWIGFGIAGVGIVILIVGFAMPRAGSRGPPKRPARIEKARTTKQ